MPKLPRVEYAEVCLALSHPRLSPYRSVSAKDKEVLKLYSQNVRLSEALYPLIQQFEVVLRNRLEQVLLVSYGTHWFSDVMFLALLDNVMSRQLQGAKAELNRWGKPHTSGAIVAELTFGFWTGLLGKTYEQAIWNSHNALIFPYALPSQRNIKVVREDLKKIRTLRNRVAHHEPIARPELPIRYKSILELLVWMNPHMGMWLVKTRLDRFALVYYRIYGVAP